MEASKLAIAKLTARRGHFTDVEEVVRPAVTWEHVYPSREEVITEAIDREVHQDHYHTTVQPVSHTETLPTRHTHNLLPQKHINHEHDNVEETKRRVADLAAQFKDITIVEPTTLSTAQLPTVVGEHWHHHVHEVVQPIIYKETVAPEVVHTVVPIHETHYEKSQFHGLSELPPKTMSEFISTVKKEGLTTSYEGPPRAYEEKLATTFDKLTSSHGVRAPVATPIRKVPAPLTTTTTTTTNTTMNVSHSPRTPIHTGFSTEDQSPASRSSSSSSGSGRSPATPKTPRSPVFRSHKDTVPNLPNTKHINSMDQPVQIAGTGGADISPRASNESYSRRGFLNKLTGRV